MNYSTRLLAVATVALASSLLAGCGGGTASVEGTASFNGEPIADGSINFVSDQGKAQAGGTIKDGKYTVGADRGLTAGKYKVEVYWNKKTGKTVIDTADTGQAKAETKQVIPEQFNKATTLTADLKGGSNSGINFDLKGTAAAGPAISGNPLRD